MYVGSVGAVAHHRDLGVAVELVLGERCPAVGVLVLCPGTLMSGAKDQRFERVRCSRTVIRGVPEQVRHQRCTEIQTDTTLESFVSL